MSEPTSVAPSAETPVPSSEEVTGDQAEQELVLEDLLVEEISIDGMCGVY